MNPETASPPRSAMQVFRMLPEGTLAEVIENTLYMSPAPSPLHQEVSMRLATTINQFITRGKLGKLFAAPIDVFLDADSNVVQPDLVFVGKTNPLVIDETGLHGVPEFIIEILSRSNQKHDLVKKKKLYEKFGVTEYWVVDPWSRRVTGFQLTSKGYRVIEEANGEISSVLLRHSFKF